MYNEILEAVSDVNVLEFRLVQAIKRVNALDHPVRETYYKSIPLAPHAQITNWEDLTEIERNEWRRKHFG